MVSEPTSVSANSSKKESSSVVMRSGSWIEKEALALVWGVKKFHTYIFARHFTLRTDHKPLTAIFSPTKAIPATTAARVQRYALFLLGFDYEIEHRSSTQHCNADGLSPLPLATTEDEENLSVDPVEAFHVSQFSILPVTWQQVRKATQRDSTLAQVYEHVMKGWHENKDPNLQPFYSRRNDLTMHQGLIVDVHSKWREVIIMHSKTTTSKTVEALQTVFARNGLPELLVSDNGPQFTAEEFQLFLKKNRVKHHVIEKQVSQAKPKGDIAGNAVSVRNYREKEKWIQEIVRARTGPVSCQVEIAPNVIWRRHIDQLLASENINDTQDLEPVTDIPGLANENNTEDETAVDIQDQQETLNR
ncbi:Transposon Tf2-9 poly [Paramuricea clavata]|uniref:Transposon Tf2-9 poly n=1 Tax=Paramuricea clavata TaxID=317549 RepID=A0A7D9IH13_PARCT|nr:Transposon Tf2-9 poly [Paramuricea clavata]